VIFFCSPYVVLVSVLYCCRVKLCIRIRYSFRTRMRPVINVQMRFDHQVCARGAHSSAPPPGASATTRALTTRVSFGKALSR
jgi:hypothetical protein